MYMRALEAMPARLPPLPRNVGLMLYLWADVSVLGVDAFGEFYKGLDFADSGEILQLGGLSEFGACFGRLRGDDGAIFGGVDGHSS